MAGTVERGREAFGRKAWTEAYDALSTAAGGERGEILDVEDLERLAVAAYLVGRDDESAQAWETAHQACLALEDPDRAARCAFWLGLAMMLRGEMARAGGWLARAGRLVESQASDCAARGYLLVPAGLHAINSGEPTTAYGQFIEAGEIATRCGDKDLLAFALLGQGQAALERALGEDHDVLARPPMLAAHVAVMLAFGDIAAARVAADDGSGGGRLRRRPLGERRARCRRRVAAVRGGRRPRHPPAHRGGDGQRVASLGRALVGDARHHKDPCTAQGISDAFADAERLAEALDEMWSGQATEPDALSRYHHDRLEPTLPMYDFTCQLASLEPPPPEMAALLKTVSADAEASRDFVSILAGTKTLPGFLSPDNIGAIMARAKAPPKLLVAD